MWRNEGQRSLSNRKTNVARISCSCLVFRNSHKLVAIEGPVGLNPRGWGTEFLGILNLFFLCFSQTHHHLLKGSRNLIQCHHHRSEHNTKRRYLEPSISSLLLLLPMKQACQVTPYFSCRPRPYVNTGLFALPLCGPAPHYGKHWGTPVWWVWWPSWSEFLFWSHHFYVISMTCMETTRTHSRHEPYPNLSLAFISPLA